MTPFASVFYEIAAVLAVAAALGGIGTLLRQPLIVSFIATGVLVGPAGLGWVTAADQLDQPAKLGERRIGLPDEPDARRIDPDPRCVADLFLERRLAKAGITSIVRATGS